VLLAQAREGSDNVCDNYADSGLSRSELDEVRPDTSDRRWADVSALSDKRRAAPDHAVCRTHRFYLIVFVDRSSSIGVHLHPDIADRHEDEIVLTVCGD
jgi:hypothetical protein